MRSAAGMQTLKSNICEIKMDLLSEEDTTKNVVKVIELEEPVKQKNQRVSRNGLQIRLKNLQGVKNSRIHKDLVNGSMIYYCFVLQKAA